jgi:hypothetical protein
MPTEVPHALATIGGVFTDRAEETFVILSVTIDLLR